MLFTKFSTDNFVKFNKIIFNNIFFGVGNFVWPMKFASGSDILINISNVSASLNGWKSLTWT